jgi:hypothetical protein
VAEYWQNRHNLNQQHLLVDVPSQPPGIPKASHFDRIDDRVAHCASGNSLSPGDYPVGVAFPHPQRPDAIFQLVNLPTPRRRMAYTYSSKTGEAQRLAVLSRRTLDRFLAEKHLLDDAEIGMLAQLDAKEMSRFAGQYFNLVEDELLSDEQWSTPERNRPGGQASRHGMICAQLAACGTKEAIPGLLDAMQRGRFLPPNPLGPYRFHWLAALAIANRDPWPEADAWLVGLLDKTELLVEGQSDGAELGATAARLLLKPRHELPGPLGLRVAAGSLLPTFGIQGYRYESPESSKQVQAWWKRQQEKEKP